MQGSNIVHEGDGSAGSASLPASTPETPRVDAQHLQSVRMERPAPVDDSDNVEPVFDKWGKVKFVARTAPEQAEEAADASDGAVRGDAGSAGIEVPPLPGTQAAPSAEVTALQNQVNQLMQAVGSLVQAQTPRPQAPVAPQPPDPTKFDFYEPEQFAEFQRLNAAYTQAIIRHEVQAALEPHGKTLEDAKWQTQYNTIAAQHGSDPNFNAKATAALELVAKYKDKFSIPEAYELVSGLPLAAPPQQPQGAPSPRPQQQARTMTPQQADAMAEKAARLPKTGNGVSSAGRPALPANVRTLGAIMAWNKQHGRA